MSTLHHKNTRDNASEPAMDDAGAAGQAILPQVVVAVRHDANKTIDGTIWGREPFAQILDALTGWHRCALHAEAREADTIFTDIIVSNHRRRHGTQPL